MKHMRTIFIMLSCLSGALLASEPISSGTESIKEVAEKGYAVIDTLFQRAHAAVSAKKDLMNAQWLGEQMNEIREIQNIVSDASIIFEFDQNSSNPIPELLSGYVQRKVSQVTPTIFEIDTISVKRVEDFYEFSHTMCKLCGGHRCGRMVRSVAQDNRESMLRLKFEKIIDEQFRKENARKLRDKLVFGTRKN